jgi:hypothetical protein
MNSDGQLENLVKRAEAVSDLRIHGADFRSAKTGMQAKPLLASSQDDEPAGTPEAKLSDYCNAHKDAVIAIVDRIMECGIESFDKGIRIVTLDTEDYAGLVFWIKLVEQRVGQASYACQYLWFRSEGGYVDLYVFFSFPSPSLLKYLFDSGHRSDMIIDANSHKNGCVANSVTDKRNETLQDAI